MSTSPDRTERPTDNYRYIAGFRITLLPADEEGCWDVWLGPYGAFDRQGEIIGSGSSQTAAMKDAAGCLQELVEHFEGELAGVNSTTA